MSTIQDAPSARTVADVLGTTQGTARIGTNEIQDRFLRLLVTQMKNQDPLNPLDNAQVTTQLAQISTVNGIEKLNATMEALAGSVGAGQSLQAAGMIGRSVLVPGSALQLAGGRGAFGVELAEAADQVRVAMHDAAGREVQVVNLGALPPGPLALEWDGATADGGRAADGTYRLTVSASRNGQQVDAQPLAIGSVQAVSQNGPGVVLDLGVLGTAGLADVRQIL